jgi:hypothetical protein
MYINSNLTAKEALRLHGQLSEQHLESLLESEEKLNAIDDIDGNLLDARGSYPDEDFLAEIIDRMQTFAKNLRGANKDTCLSIIEALDDIQTTTMHASDYGRSELSSALKVIK